MAIQFQPWMRWLGAGWLWNPERGVQLAGPGSHNESRVAVNDTTAMQVGAVFRCISIIAQTAGNLPMYAYRRSPNGDREQLARDHWLSRLIDEPNEEMTGDELRESNVGQMAGWGNAYSQIVRNAAGRPTELWPYRVDRMKVERLETLALQYTYPDINSRPTVLDRKRVLHMRAFSLDGVMGLSPLGFASQTLGLAIGANNYAARFFAKGGRPPGIMTSEKALTDRQREQIRQEYGDMAQGEGAKSFWLLEAALKYQAIAVNPEDMQMLQTRSFEIAEIARFFGVPLFLLMETEKSTSWGSGLEQANLAFLTYTLRPYLSRIENSYNRWIIPDAERKDIFVAIDEEALLRADLAALSAFYKALGESGVLTPNEIRRRLKQPRSTQTNADSLLVQGAMLPIDKLGQKDNTKPLDAVTVRQILDDSIESRMREVEQRQIATTDGMVRALRETYGALAGDLQRIAQSSHMTADTLPRMLAGLSKESYTGKQTWQRDARGRVSGIVWEASDGKNVLQRIERDAAGQIVAIEGKPS